MTQGMTRAMTQGYLIGMDGGGTGCRVAVARADGTILGRGTGGPANATSDFALCVQSLTAALDAALAAASLPLAAVQDCAAVAGVAGVISADLGQTLARALPLPRLTVVEDRDTMLTGALQGRDGALAAIGTGSFFSALSGGKARSVGGWGFQLSDEASGAWLGREALRRALQAQDGLCAMTPLLQSLLDDLGGVPGVIAFAGTARAQDYASLAPRLTVTRDEAAIALMTKGAACITRALFALGHVPGAPLCLTGGVGPAYATFLPPEIAAGLMPPAGTALDGALLMAQRVHP